MITEKSIGSSVDVRGRPYNDSDSISISTDGSVDRGLTSTFDHETIRPTRRTETELTLTNDDDFYDYSNGWVLTSVAYAIWIAVLCANVFSIYQIGSGQA